MGTEPRFELCTTRAGIVTHGVAPVSYEVCPVQTQIVVATTHTNCPAYVFNTMWLCHMLIFEFASQRAASDLACTLSRYMCHMCIACSIHVGGR